jgi:CysZ protein
LARGFRYPFESFGFFRRNPRLLLYVAIPFVINLVVFAVAVYFGLDALDALIRHWLPQGDAWYIVALAFFLRLLAKVLVGLATFFTFVLVGSVVAAPFNELLCEKTEAVLRGGAAGPPFRWGPFLRETLRSMFEEVRRLSWFLLGMLGLLLLALVPAAGQTLAPILSFLFLVYFLVVDYTGFVLSRHGCSFRAQRQYIRSRRSLMFGFGMGVFCLVSIPFLQLLAMPLAVVGATRLYCDFPPLCGADPPSERDKQ